MIDKFNLRFELEPDSYISKLVYSLELFFTMYIVFSYSVFVMFNDHSHTLFTWIA